LELLRLSLFEFKAGMMKVNLVATYLYTYENEGMGCEAWKHVWCPH